MKIPMRRADREVTDPAKIEEILKNCPVLRVAIPDEEYPYVVPVNYGWTRSDSRFTFYFHSSQSGRKARLLGTDGGRRVGFETDRLLSVGSNGDGSSPCRWTCRFESVIGEGIAQKATSEEEKRVGLDALMRRSGFEGALDYDAKSFELADVYKIEVVELSAKRH